MSALRGKPRLGVNVLSNLSANVWLAALSLLAIPVIYKALGPAQYALVGLYLLAIQWSVFVDLGMSPALGRYAAQQNAPGGSYPRVRFMLSRFELITAAMAAVVVLAGMAIYRFDLPLLPQAESSVEQAAFSGLLLCIGLALRVQANLYRAGLTGLEHQLQVSFVNALATGLRFGLPILLVLPGWLTLERFFAIQVGVGLLETVLFRIIFTARLGPRSDPVAPDQMRAQLLLGLSIAGLGVLWILTLQIDKLVLSRALPIEAFGDYALAVQLAGAVGLATTPIQTAVLPRMTAQMAAGEHQSVASIYTTSCLVSIAIGVAAMFAVLVCGRGVLALLTGAERAAGLEILVACYTLATGLIAIMALNYSLQNAAGTLRWHWLGASGLALVQLPLMLVLAKWGDVLKLALTYLLTLAVYVVYWLHHAHGQILQMNHANWLKQVLVYPGVAAAAIGGACLWLFAGETGWHWELLQGGTTFAAVFTIVVCTSAEVRRWLRRVVARA